MAEEIKSGDPLSGMRHLIGKVAERHGIRIDFSDPAFYVLSLNEFALEEAAKTIVDGVRQATREFEMANEAVQRQAGALLAQQVVESVAAARLQFEEQIAETSRITTERLGSLSRIHERYAIHWLLAGLFSGLLLFGIGILVGLWL
jgi:hypothetical protein